MRPPSVPTRADSEACTSRQKSASDEVRTWALSSARLFMPPLLLLLLVLPPLLPLPVLLLPALLPLPAPPVAVIELELTRMSLAPWRRPGR